MEGSDLSVRRTLDELQVPRSTFYRWYRAYEEDGYAGLEEKPSVGRRFWNRIPESEWEKVVEAAHARSELRRDYQAIIRARDGLAARQAYEAFLRKWSKLCPAVARSLAEAGVQLLTFYEFPKGMWKSLRTTNALENLNREFRRRTKTQGSFSTEEAAVTLLYGLVAFGQIRMRKIDGHKQLVNLLQKEWTHAA